MPLDDEDRGPRLVFPEFDGEKGVAFTTWKKKERATMLSFIFMVSWFQLS